jgi:cytochrome c oxidase subunit 4
MSAAEETHEEHEEHHGPDYEHPDGQVHAHVTSWKFYVGVFFALILLTILTVAVASVHLGSANLAVAVIIASAKAALVCAFFMHLSSDNRFHALILVSTVMFIGVFFAYTINDTGHRGRLDVDSQSGARTYLPSGDKAPGSWERPVIGEEPQAEGKKPEKK